MPVGMSPRPGSSAARWRLLGGLRLAAVARQHFLFRPIVGFFALHDSVAIALHQLRAQRFGALLAALAQHLALIRQLLARFVARLRRKEHCQRGAQRNPEHEPPEEARSAFLAFCHVPTYPSPSSPLA